MSPTAPATAGRISTSSTINENPVLQKYYASLESRIGYKLILGDSRHFGYYDKDTYWPFPFYNALVRMEGKLEEALSLPKGSKLLDAGCGAGRVATRMAGRGYRVSAIDVVERHVAKARQFAARCAAAIRKGGDGAVDSVQRMDYHHLDKFQTGSFDGVYTMEAFVHATDPLAVLKGFHRIVRPGGRVVLFEYEHPELEQAPAAQARSMRQINKWSAMPTNEMSLPGFYQHIFEEAGFTDFEIRDYSKNIIPMTRVFYLLAYIPFIIVRLFRLERYFINTIAGVETYRGAQHWRYLCVSAKRPE